MLSTQFIFGMGSSNLDLDDIKAQLKLNYIEINSPTKNWEILYADCYKVINNSYLLEISYQNLNKEITLSEFKKIDFKPLNPLEIALLKIDPPSMKIKKTKPNNKKRRQKYKAKFEQYKTR